MTIAGEPRQAAAQASRIRRWAGWACALAATALVVAGPAAVEGPQSGAARRLRGLYVTGGGFHEFVKQETIVPPAVAEHANIDWTIDHTAGTSTEVLIERHRTADWAKQFDVVLYNMSFSHVVDVDWIERLAGAHRESGVGAVILHGAVHSYRRSTTRAWGQLMGAFSLRHDAQRPLTVEVLQPNHPIMRGVPAKWVTIPEELYEHEQSWPGLTPLAQAYSIESKKTYPVIWTNTHGKARVFVTSLGHNTAMIADPIYLGIVSRGLLWTVDQLQDDGLAKPAYRPR